MAVFIDRRPKLNWTAIIICSIALIFMLSGLKGCNSDYSKDKLTETSTAVVIIEKFEYSTSGAGDHLLKYRVGEDEGKLLVTTETFKSASPGKTMYFTLSKSDYEGYGWVTLFWLLSVIGIIATPISLAYVVISIFRRYL